MRILNDFSLHPSSGVNTIEPPHIFLAEELHQLMSVEEIPHDILIKGDLTIDSSNIRAFTLLQSKHVKIEGLLTFRDLSLIQFPEKLTVEKNLNFSECKALTALPKGLKVIGSLDLHGCTEITYLPEDVEVEGDLNLSKCIALTTIPNGLKIKGSLDLSKCVSLTHLPEGLIIEGDLDLSKCTALKALPKMLKIKGDLDLLKCTGLTYLPEDLTIEGTLNLSECTALTTVPKGLKTKGSLIITDCTGLTHLPEGLIIEDGVDILRCTGLTHLPEDLTIEGTLDLSGCTALTTVPKGLKIKDSLIIADCTGLTHLPEDLTIEGTLDLSGCTALTTLPKMLKIKGDLILSKCVSLTHLPEDLIIEGTLDLFKCKALTALPKMLKIKGDLILSRCTGLTHLPENLTIEGDLDLSKCIALTTVPKGLKIKGSLNLSECTGLTRLSEDLTIEGGLNLNWCTALTALPERFKIKGSLDLYGCTGLTYLPEDLTVRQDLNLFACTALTALPRSLELGGNLDLSECTHLTSLPNWIITLGKCSSGQIRTIDLTGCGLSPAVIRRLQEDTRDIEGMQFHFSNNAVGDYVTQFSTLLLAVQFWQKEAGQKQLLIPKKVCQQLHDRLTQVQDYENLLRFLTRLTGTRDYYNNSTRSVLAIRVLQMLRLMTENEKLCHHAAFLIHQGLSSCDDRVMGVLDDIGFYQKLCYLQHAQITEEELKTAGKSFFLLDKLNKKIRECIKRLKFVDEVEVYMAFHTALQEMLALPIETKDMLFRRCVDISDEEITQIGKEVLQEASEEAWLTFLAVWDPWVRYQRRVSTLSWELLPPIEKLLSSIDICPYLQETPIQPVLYNNVVYDYDAFIRRYIEEGVDLYGAKVTIKNLLRIKIPKALQPSSNSLDKNKRKEFEDHQPLKKFKKGNG